MKNSSPTRMRRLHGLMFKLPLMIGCDEFETFIIAYLEDELAGKEKFIFEMHLKVCRECREYLAAYRASTEVTKLAMSDEEINKLADVPEDLVTAIIAAQNSK